MRRVHDWQWATACFALAWLATGEAAPVAGQHSQQHTCCGGDHAAAGAAAGEPLRQSGQAVFGALREVLDRLEADPATDWSRVDLDGLREHLVQMDLVFRGARVVRAPLADGMRYTVSGDADVLAAAGAMGAMHARQLRAEQPSWRVEVESRAADVVFEVRSSDPAQQAKIRGLGFFGLLATGAHHAAHHWALAAGGDAHAHH